MAELDYTNISPNSIATPASGVSASFVSSVTKTPMLKIDTGAIQGQLSNQSVSTPGAGFSSDTYLVGSSIAIPDGWLRVGTRYRLIFDVTKTAAGTATPIIIVRIGTLGTTGDAAILTFTFGAGTAAIDTGIVEIDAVFRTVGSGTSAVLQGFAEFRHSLAATGLTSTGASGIGILTVTSSGFSSVVASSIIGASVNGGASAAWTINLVRAELINI